MSLPAAAVDTLMVNMRAFAVGAGVLLVPQLTICSEVGFTNQILYSDSVDAPNWQVLSNVLATSNPYFFVDERTPLVPKRFYRVRVLMPPDMARIPAGSFGMGDYLDEGDFGEVPAHNVSVSEFYLDKNDVYQHLWGEVYTWAVTNGYSFDGGASAKGKADPMQSMSWYDAVKWCNARSEMEGKRPAYYVRNGTWPYRTGDEDLQDSAAVNWSTGYRLPTEAEWEKAARGGDHPHHRFPWKNVETITHSLANYRSATNFPYDTSSTRGYHPTFDVNPLPYTSPPGHFPTNGYGLHDMAGNLFQWCWDWYSDTYYNSAPPWTDPLGPASSPAGARVRRGGSWDSYAYLCRVAYRGANAPGAASANTSTGFRTALRPPPAPVITNIMLVVPMALIPAGSFTMGNCMNASEGNPNELPLHTVTVSAFCMDKYDVTKALWDRVYHWGITHGYSFDNAGSGKGVDHPVVQVN